MSTGLFYLNETDFIIKENQKGKSLTVGLDGYSLVLFYSTKCQHCQSLIPIFKKLPQTVGGCTFAMVNVSQNKGLISKSATTRSPIKYVPLLILHINGEPYMRYDGPHKNEEIKSFVIEIAQKVSKNKKPQSNATQQVHNNVATSSKEVPAYTIGVPKNAGNRNEVCYLGFESAYVSK
jgi:thiol-disulfide isomerase/thioredoxin